MSEKRLITIMLADTSDGHIYEVDAYLTDAQVRRAKKLFGKLLKQGYIRPADATDPQEIEYIVYETPQRAPVDFMAIKRGIEGGADPLLSGYVEELGIIL
jgi:hypothetical protein